MTHGQTYEVKTEQGDLYITINEDEAGVVEVFLNIGKSGSFTQGYTEALGRMISMSLRSGIKPESIIKQLQGIRTSTPTLNRGMFVYSVPDAVAKILKRHIDEQKQQIKMFKEDVSETVVAVNQNIPVKELESDIKFEVKYQESKPTLQMVKEESQNVAVITDESNDTKYSRDNDFGDMLDCPDCGSDLEYAEGCILCRACGYSKCG